MDIDKTTALRHFAQYVADQRAVRAEWEDGNREWVEVARAAGASWTEIGKAMRTSKQAAQQRYGAEHRCTRVIDGGRCLLDPAEHTH